MELKDIVEKFDSFGYYINDKIERDIEENRKGQFSFNFYDENGNILDDVKVSVKQLDHEFKFGCTTFYLDNFGDERDEIYKEKFANLFNYGVIPFYWDTLEPEQGNPRFDKNAKFISRRPPTDKSVAFCKQHNMRMKGHCLVYNAFQPDWISNDNREIKIQIDKRISEIASRYGNDICDFDVINEMISIYKNCYKGNSLRNLQITDELNHEKWSFDMCKRYFPYSSLFWNEGGFETFDDNYYKGHRSFYYMTLKDHIMRGTPIEGIGMQFHAFCDDCRSIESICNPLRIIDVLEKYSDFKLPIHLSEISIPSFSNEAENEYYQAELVKRLYSLWFSQKYVESTVWWNFADYTAYHGENKFHAGLLRNDCTEKDSYKVLDELINHKWRTNFNDRVNKRLNFRGFYGNYEITAEKGDKKVRKTVRLFRDTTGFDNRLKDFRSVDIVIK